MAVINSKRVWMGALAGGLLWTLWSFAIQTLVIGEARYQKAQQAGVLLTEPRYPYFPLVWILSLFVLSYGGAWLYARVRNVAGAGPKTAACVGAWLGFAAGFPGNFAQSAWLNADRVLPPRLDAGPVGRRDPATLVAGWLYREA
jgi:hypothetical protein